MAFSSSAANGRRAASLFSSTAAHAIACLLFAIAGLGWSGQSLAQSCDFVSLTPATQVNVPGGTVSFTLEAQTACNTTVDITLGIAPGETTGGAAITPPTAPTIALDTPYTFDVTLGGLEGGSGTVIATCLNGGCAGDTLSFNFATTDIDYLAIPPTSLVVAEGDGFTIGTHVEINGAPTTAISTAFSNVTTGFNYGTVVPDAGGDAMSPTISITGEGSFVLRGTPVCPAAAPIPGCSALLPVDFNVLVEGTSVTAVAPTSVTIPSGDTTTLTAYFGSPSVPEPDGSTLTWSVTQPAGGDGIVTGNPVAGGAGESTGDFTASVPGVYTVTAFTPVTAFLPNTASFTVTVTAVPTLSVEQGDGQVSPVGVPFPDTLMAFADDSGTSPVGLQIDWTLVSGSATFPATSLTDGGGNAEITVTPTAVGPIQIVASRSDAPTATATFNLTATAGTPTITAVSADPGAGTVGSPQAFTVLVESGGLPVVGGTVSWTATAPFAPASGTSTTDASGEATASFTPSAAGNFTNVVTATFDQDGIPSSGDEVSYSFGANVAAVPTLAINAGDGQTGDVGTAYATDLSVTAQNSGLPAGGVTIDWVVTSGSATIVANGPTDFTGGMASATVTPTAAGPITITATRQDAPTATVTFNLTANAVLALTATAGDGQSVDVGTTYPTPLQVLAENSGLGAGGVGIAWAVTSGTATIVASGPTDVNGIATATVTPTSVGPITITATRSDDASVFVTFNLTATAVETLAIAGGNGQTGPVGTAYPVALSVLAEDSGVAATGIGIDWLVTSGNATLTAATTTDGTGTATNTVTPTAAGPITITASRQDAPTVTVTFNLTATALPYALSAVSANPAAGTVGAPVTFTVALDQGGTPLPAETISWSAGAPFAPASATSATDGAGEASATFTASAAGTFPGAIVATYDPDGVPASGDEVVYAFDANIAAVPTLAINSGDGQTTPVGTTYPAVLSVLAEDSGVPAAGVVIDWVVTAGTATIVPSGPTDAVGEAHLSVTPTSVGAITITATRQDAPAATVTFNLTATALPKTLTAVTPNPASGVVGTPIDFTVLLEQAGVPQAGGLIAWTATAPFAPANASVGTDASGEATATFTPSAAGTFTGAVTALYDGDGVPASGDELSVVFDVDVTAVASLAITGGDGQAALTGTAFAQPLQVLAEDSGVPAAGVTIDWVVVSGSATLVPGAATDAAGGSSATVTAGAPGPIVITATRADDATAQVTFNLTSTAAAHLLARVSPNPATSTVGVAFPVTVELTQGGVPVAGATVQWNAGASLAPATASSITDAAGRATTSFTSSAAGTFANAIVAGVDPDGVPANGDEATVAFDVDIAAVASLAIAGGDGQSALPGTTFAAPLQVLAEDSGTPAAGVGITWTLVSGSATIAPAGPTDPTGTASATLTAGAVDGPVVISATRQDAPGATVTFNLTVSALGTLVVVEGDDQTLLAGIPSDPLQVELRDGGGAPVAGATITWSTTAGTLASATSVTDASGIASNTVTTNTVGEVQVTAASPLAGAPAVFALNGGLSNLGGLDPVQQQVVEAIDELCPALAALPSPTPAEADLLARCRELTDAGGIDPDATVIALDELMTDVALAQGQAALLALQAQFQNLKARIAALRSGTRGTSFGGLAVNTSTGPMSLETLASAFTAEDEPEAPAGEAGTDFDRWGFFAAGTIGRGEQDECSVDPAFDYDIEGLTAGFDYRKSDNLVFGGAFGYTRQDTALPDHGGSVDTTGWTLSGYGTWYTKDSWYADGVVTFGRNDYDLVRHIDYTVPLAGGGTRTIAQTARANAAGDLLQGAFTFGRDFNRGALGIGPYAKLLYTRVSLDAIEEQLDAGELGHGLGLRVEERELTSLASVIGGKLTYTHSTDWGVLMPHLQLEWEHEFKDDPQAIEARFLHDPTSTPMFVRGDAIDTDYFRLGLGLSMVLSRGRSGFLYYEQVLSRDGVSQYNLALGLRLEF